MTPIESLLVQHRRTLLADGSFRDDEFVRCQRQGDWIAPAECEVCAHCAHVSMRPTPGAGVVICRHAGEPAAPDEAASLLEPSVLCIEGGVTVRAAREALANQRVPAVVVDRDGHPLGMISASELRDAEPAMAVSELARRGVASLLEGGSISDAQSLGRKLGQTAVPVVRRGRVLGLVVLR